MSEAGELLESGKGCSEPQIPTAKKPGKEKSSQKKTKNECQSQGANEILVLTWLLAQAGVQWPEPSTLNRGSLEMPP